MIRILTQDNATEFRAIFKLLTDEKIDKQVKHMDKLERMINFLLKLEEKKIHYVLTKVRDGIMVEAAVPGQRWEIEFMLDGSVEIEKFISDGELFDESELEALFRAFSE